MDRWHLTQERKDKFIPILTEYFTKLESLTDAEVERLENKEMQLDLYDSGLSPYTLKCLLEEHFGYEKISQNNNGWEMDLWINLRRKDNKTFDSTCEAMTIQSCGQTFTLILTPTEMMYL